MLVTRIRTLINLQDRKAEMSRTAAFRARLGISASARADQYLGRRLTLQAPLVDKRWKSLWKLAVFTIWNPPHPVADIWVTRAARLSKIAQKDPAVNNLKLVRTCEEWTHSKAIKNSFVSDEIGVS